MARIEGVPEAFDEYDPVEFSDEENIFIKEHVGQGPTTAFHEAEVSNGFCKRDVVAFLQRIKDLQEVERAHGVGWVGEAAIKSRADLWMDYRRRFNKAKKANPKSHHPSMFHFSSDGKEHFQGVGSDRGKVRTYFAEDGTRKPWALPLRSDAAFNSPQASWGSESAVKALKTEGLVLNENLTEGWVECSVCGHREVWDSDKARGRGPARAAMKRHCLSARKEVNLHRKLAVEVWGQ